ncbi:hypothetical protein AB0L47_34540 [Streptomyces bobili]|uniref:hypothetical protein n=1 Tax=Streptomyces bobili TaxID=67280 RepID=UPI003449507C
MTAARDYEDVRYALEHLSPLQVRRLRLIISQDEELAEALPEREDEADGEVESDEISPGLRALFGSIHAPSDFGENHDHYTRERMERRLGTAE